MKVKSEREVAQSCPTLRDPMDCSLPGSSVHGIFEARVLEWGAITFSKKPLSPRQSLFFIDLSALNFHVNGIISSKVFVTGSFPLVCFQRSSML